MKPWLAVLAMGLAGAGIGASLMGDQLSSPWLEHRGGPALTIAGAVLWVVARWRAKRD